MELLYRLKWPIGNIGARSSSGNCSFASPSFLPVPEKEEKEVTAGVQFVHSLIFPFISSPVRDSQRFLVSAFLTHSNKQKEKIKSLQ